MKTLKKTVLIVLTFTFLLGISGYLYFDKKFTPPENYLSLKNSANEIPIKWISNKISPISAMLLPVKIEGIPKTFYMQFDLGSTNTKFYLKPLQSIQVKHPTKIEFKREINKIPLQFYIKNMEISSTDFQLINYGKDIEWDNIDALNIIGTIGTDLLEKRVVTLDFKNNLCSFNLNIPDNNRHNFSQFKFNKRRILLPAVIDNEKLNLLYDSGTSAFELVTDKKHWDSYSLTNGKTTTSKGNSWGKTLHIYTKSANKNLKIGAKTMKLSEVTYIEGTSTLQNMLMRFSGMQGMIGNKLFMDHILTLDCKQEKFSID